MLRQIQDSNNFENVFIRRSCARGLRLDGRSLQDTRPVDITIQRHDNYCMSEVNRLDSKIVCVITSEVVAPFPDRATEGIINISIRSKDNAKETDLKRLLDRCIRDSDIIDLESLCIVSGEYVWIIHIDIRIIDNSSGNTIDLVLLAAISTIRAFRKPDVTVQTVDFDLSNLSISQLNSKLKTKLKVYHSSEREPLPLALYHVPLSLSIAIFRLKDTDMDYQEASRFSHPNIIPSDRTNTSLCLVLDPSYEESQYCDAIILVAMNSHKEICFINKPGGISVPLDVIKFIVNICIKPIEKIHNTLQIALNRLEEQVNKQRIEQLELIRNYQLAIKGLNESMNDNVENNNNIIDLNDPMLQWNNLHKAATLPA